MAEQGQTESAGAALVRLRWAKTTAAERRKFAMMMVAARLRKRKPGTVRSKSKRRKASK